MSSPELIIKIGANSERYRKELKSIEKQSDASVKRMRKNATIAAAGLAAAGAGALASFNEFRAFEKTFSNVSTLLDDTSFKTKTLSGGIRDLKDGVGQLARETGQPFEVLNQGLFDLVSAGVDAEKAIEALGVSSRLAIAGGTDTSVAVDGITSALNAYSLEASEAQSIAEKFFTAQKFGKTNIEELSSSFGQVGATAASLGVSLDEVLGSVSAATTAGIQTSQAYTGLKAVFANVIKPTKDAAVEAERLGVAFDAQALREKGLKQFLDDVTGSAKFNADSLGKLFGSVEALNVVTALAGNQSDEFNDILNALGDEAQSAATFIDAYAVKSATADQAIARLNGTLADSRRKLGEFISPAVIAFANEATETIVEFEIGLKALGVIISGVATIMTESLGSAFAFILSGFNSVQAKIDGFVANINDAAAKLPFIGDDRREGFQANADRARVSQTGNENQAAALAFEGIKFFSPTTDEELEAELSRQLGFQEKTLALMKDGIDAERDLRVTGEEDDREAGLSDPLEEQTDEEFDETTEKQEDRLDALQEGREKATKKDIDARSKAAKEKEKIKKEETEKLMRLDEMLSEQTLSNAESLFDDQTAIGKALFLFRKAQNIASIVTNTQEAMSLARATLPPPAGDIQAAKYAIQGAVSVGLVGATAIQGVSAQQGGVVQGVGAGDRVPALLEAGEIVVPKKYNPLSPNFDETFGGMGGGRVEVDIMLDENASKLLTAQQREDTVLGINR